MCDPTGGVLTASILGAVGAAAQANAQREQVKATNNAARANALEANRAAVLQNEQLGLQQSQERDAAATALFDVSRANRRASAAARASVAASGIQGVTASALEAQVDAQGAEALGRTAGNVNDALGNQRFTTASLDAGNRSAVNAANSQLLTDNSLLTGAFGVANAGLTFGGDLTRHRATIAAAAAPPGGTPSPTRKP